jgi:hypothetical protein
MEIIPPDCYTDLKYPCSEKDWVQCIECGQYVCLVHDEITKVQYSEDEPSGEDKVCNSCAEALYEAGVVSLGEQYQYINRR